ncbi:uncharacterized protein VTP21DRAFT_10530 [Calcarisporiella thermophila]|uniref:uncharacterized protein n=1 Tax=Calcarisporiella thermophila TaxID=911321 RepID=UPI003743A90A
MPYTPASLNSQINEKATSESQQPKPTFKLELPSPRFPYQQQGDYIKPALKFKSAPSTPNNESVTPGGSTLKYVHFSPRLEVRRFLATAGPREVVEESIQDEPEIENDWCGPEEEEVKKELGLYFEIGSPPLIPSPFEKPNRRKTYDIGATLKDQCNSSRAWSPASPPRPSLIRYNSCPSPAFSPQHSDSSGYRADISSAEYNEILRRYCFYNPSERSTTMV